MEHSPNKVVQAQMQSMRERNNHHDWQLLHQRQQKSLSKKEFWSTDDLFHRYWMEEEAYLSLLGQFQRIQHELLDQKIEALDTWYVAAMLKNVCQWLNHQNVLKEKDENIRYQRFIEFLGSGIELYLIHPIIH